jgi:hypothetical protein
VSHIEHVQALMEELGPADDEIAAVLRTDEAEWAVAFEFEEDKVIVVELDAETGRLYLSTDLGIPAPEHRLAVYETLLTYNAMLRQTGGVLAALNGPGADLLQMMELDAGGLTLDQFGTVLANFQEKAMVWRAYVASGEGAPTVEALPSDIGIRV